MSRLAWFSPMPPVATGVAACSADLVAALGGEHQIDVFVDEAVARVSPGTRSAHDFVWRHQQQPYDLTVYQVGNSSHHDYQWPYLFRYPGLTVLHDAHLHHARAAALLRTFRAAGLPHGVRVESPRRQPGPGRAGGRGLRQSPLLCLADDAPGRARLEARGRPRRGARRPPARRSSGRPRRGHPAWTGHTAVGRRGARRREPRARPLRHLARRGRVRLLRRAHRPTSAFRRCSSAFAATRAYVPTAHLLLAGAVPAHYDLRRDIERRGLSDAVDPDGVPRVGRGVHRQHRGL